MDIILGAAAAVIVQFIKKYFELGSWQSWGIAIVISIAVGTIYTTIKDTSYWATVLATLTNAGAIYAFIISMFPKSTSQN